MCGFFLAHILKLHAALRMKGHRFHFPEELGKIVSESEHATLSETLRKKKHLKLQLLRSQTDAFKIRAKVRAFTVKKHQEK